MILESGTKLLVVHRRLFEKDRPRYFIGSVDCFEDGIARVTGNTWVQDLANGNFIKKDDSRTKIISVLSTGLLIYCLPGFVNLSELRFDYTSDNEVLLRDKGKFAMDMSESLHARVDYT